MNTVLNAKPRDVAKEKSNQLRKIGLVPAELYGHGIENLHLAVNKNDFSKLFRQVGENQIIQLKIEGEAELRNVLAHELQKDPRSGLIVHVDFHQVRMDEKITAEIPLNFIGKSDAVEVLGGSLAKNLHSIKVRALPADLPAEIAVDISKLKAFEDHILAGDLSLPEKVELVDPTGEVVASIVMPKAEAEVAPPATEAEAIEKIQVAKKEGKPAEEVTQKSEEKSE